MEDVKERPQGDNDAESSGSFAATERSKLWQTKVRESITPFLPPPVTKAMKQFDHQFAPSIGPEASITAGSTVFAAWILWFLVIVKGRHLFMGNGKAVADDEENERENILSADNEKFDASVILCGPSSGGKTRIFFQLCHGPTYADVPTLMSLKPNVAIGVYKNQKDQNNDHQPSIRYMDWPGSASLKDPSFVSLVTSQQQSTPLRIVLVVDATQPVAAAAETLFALLQLAKQRSESPRTIFVACHKKDIPKAKNYKRIKIQIRSELEKLLAVQAKAAKAEAENEYSSKSDSLWWPAGKPLDLDELSFCTLHFAPTSCSEGGLSELIDFCTNGIISS